MSLSIGAIGGIDTVGAYSPVSAVSRERTNAYQIKNDSEVSDAYIQSEKINGPSGAVEPSSPVQYSTAQIETNRIQGEADSVNANKAYNQLAFTFNGSTGYDSTSSATSYGMVGQNIDVFA